MSLGLACLSQVVYNPPTNAPASASVVNIWSDIEQDRKLMLTKFESFKLTLRKICRKVLTCSLWAPTFAFLSTLPASSTSGLW